MEKLIADIYAKLNEDSRMVIWSPCYGMGKWDVHIDLEWRDDEGSIQRVAIKKKDNDLMLALTKANDELDKVQGGLPESQPLQLEHRS